MIVIGLTGGIGMGKSTVARMMHGYGIPVFDADRYVHRGLNARGLAVRAVRDTFPHTFDPKGQKIDRKALSAWITGRPLERKKLEGILHPLVRSAEIRFINRHRQKKTPVIVLDIPLLFETEANRLCDVVICVSAPPEIRQNRVMRRPGMNEKTFKDIVKAQMKESLRRKKSDFVLETGGTFVQTEADLQKLLKRIKRDYA